MSYYFQQISFCAKYVALVPVRRRRPGRQGRLFPRRHADTRASPATQGAGGAERRGLHDAHIATVTETILTGLMGQSSRVLTLEILTIVAITLRRVVLRQGGALHGVLPQRVG